MEYHPSNGRSKQRYEMPVFVTVDAAAGSIIPVDANSFNSLILRFNKEVRTELGENF